MTVSLVLCAFALCPVARALERVHLTSGFSYDCTAQEPVDAEHMRLFLYTPGSTAESSNYVVVSRQQIASVEAIPDPPVAAQVAAVAPVTATAPPTDIHELLAKAGAQHNIDVELLASVVKTESNGRSDAVSRTGARGLMQLMPGTARDLGVQDAFRPDQNIAGGVSYLDALLTRYRNDLSLALAAYNAGPAAVDKYHGIPPYRETRAYVARVEREFVRRKKAAAHAAANAMATVVTP
jgi:soluble lytic murein transglycosylase-like protein